MEVTAKARYIRISPRKVRLVADLVRGLDVTSAESQLKFMRKAAAKPVFKVVMSAKANAEHNFKLDGAGLYIKTITVDGGPVLHRWMPRAFGRATPLRKRSSHITVVLGERSDEGVPQAAVAKAVVGESVQSDDAAAAAKKPSVRKGTSGRPSSESSVQAGSESKKDESEA